MMDLEIREFENAIVDFTNKKDLPIEVKRLVFAEIMQELSVVADNEIKFQILDREEKERVEKAKSESEATDNGNAETI